MGAERRLEHQPPLRNQPRVRSSPPRGEPVTEGDFIIASIATEGLLFILLYQQVHPPAHPTSPLPPPLSPLLILSVALHPTRRTHKQENKQDCSAGERDGGAEAPRGRGLIKRLPVHSPDSVGVVLAN